MIALQDLARRHPKVFGSFVLGFITLGLYAPAIGFDFIHFDDYSYVVNNPIVRDGFSLKGILDTFSTFHAQNWHPVTWLSHMLDCELFGLDPGMHHFVNALIHTMTGEAWKSFLAAALFAWHPLHVESVAWISERKDVLFTFFWILTLWSHWRYAEKPCAKRNLLTLLFCCLALMAKPMAVTLPVVLLLMDFWPLKRFGKPIETDGPLRQQAGRLILEKTALFVAVLFTCILAVRAQHLGGAISDLEHLPLLSRLTNTFVAYLSYLRMMVWPIDLAILYPHSYQVHAAKAIGSAVVFIAITVWVLRIRKKYPFGAIGWLWYIITLVPVIGIVQVGVQAMADRYTYIPLIGIFIMIAWGVELFVNKRPSLKPVVLVGMSIILAGCLYLTRIQIYRWKDSVTLFTHTLSVTENNWIAHGALGWGYFDRHEYDKAQLHLSSAIQSKPDNEVLRVKLGSIFSEQGNTGGAIMEYQKALRINPRSFTAYSCLGKLYGQQDHPEKMLSCYREALAILPNDRKTKNLIAWTLSTHPDEMIRNGPEALELCEKLDFLEKPDAEYFCVLAAAYAEVGRFEEAISTAEKALEKDQKKKDNELREKILDCLKHYRQRQPYRDALPLTE
jgi:Tfp pilus assembly protein PilF